MAEIVRIVEACGHPTFVSLQEVTPSILALLSSASWWERYVASDPPWGAPYFTMLLARRDAVGGTVTPRSFRRSEYNNSAMGRCLLTLMATVGGVRLAVATSHLESPCPPGDMFVGPRRQQMQMALEVLEDAPLPNVLFAGRGPCAAGPWRALPRRSPRACQRTQRTQKRHPFISAHAHCTQGRWHRSH
jgi:hypothetical protein